MAVITRLVASKGRSKKVRVYLDGKYAFSLEADGGAGSRAAHQTRN